MNEKLKKRSSDDLSELSKKLKKRQQNKSKSIIYPSYTKIKICFILLSFFNIFDSSERSSEERFFSFSIILLSFLNMLINKKTKKTIPPWRAGWSVQSTDRPRASRRDSSSHLIVSVWKIKYIFNTVLCQEHSCNWNALNSIQKCNDFITMMCFPIKNQ